MLHQLRHKIFNNKFKYIIAPLIISIATAGLIFENIVLIYHYFFYNMNSISLQLLPHKTLIFSVHYHSFFMLCVLSHFINVLL